MFGISIAALLTFISAPLFATTVQTNICQPVTAPTFTTQNNTTSAATEVIAGSTSPSISVSIDNNAHQVATTTSDSSGDFSLQVSLSVGTNSLTATATNNCGSVTGPTPLVITMTAPPAAPTTPVASTPPATPTQPAATTSSSSSQTTTVTPQASNTSDASDTTNTTTPQTVTVAPSTTDKPQALALKMILPAGAQSTTNGTGTNAITTVTTTDVSVFLKGMTEASAAVTLSNNSEQVAQLTAALDGSFGVLVPLKTGTNNLTIEAVLGASTTRQSLTYIRNPVGNSQWLVWPIAAAGFIIGFIVVGGLIIAINKRIQLKGGKV